MQLLFGTLSFTTEEDDDLEGPTQEQEERRTMTIDFEFYRGLKKLGDHVSSGHQATSYDKSDRQSSAITDRDFIDDYLIIRVSS
jgi:hypothetical protein